MASRISKKQFVKELAMCFTASSAHSKDYNRNHEFAVNMAYALWALTGESHCNISDSLLDNLKCEINKL